MEGGVQVQERCTQDGVESRLRGELIDLDD